MFKRLSFKNLISITALACALPFTACSETVPESPSITTDNVNVDVSAKPVVKEKARTSMLENAIFDYELPTVNPSIIVDTVGYAVDSDKIAIVFAKTIPASFEVCDAATGNVVYKGYVKKETCPEDADGKTTGTIDFTDLKTSGKYYISCSIVGSSKPFEIKDGIYDELFTQAYFRLKGLRCDEATHGAPVPLESDRLKTIDVSGGWYTGDKGQRDVCEGCTAVQDLLLVYEYFSKSFTDDYGSSDSGNKIPDVLDEARYEVEWLLKMQNPDTGGVYTSISFSPGTGTSDAGLVILGETNKATAYFCTTLAKFSYSYKKYDSNFASECLKAAAKAWKCLAANREIVDDTQMYRAACELYRASYASQYMDEIASFLKAHYDSEFTDRTQTDAAFCYMSTTKGTEAKYCNVLMQTILSNIELKSNAAETSRYLVQSKDLTTSELLRNVQELVVIDYALSSSEYHHIIDDYIHYLCGRNELSINLLEKEYSPGNLAKLIGILGKVK